MAKKSGKGINYKITCGNCGSHIMEYYKSSPGALLRCYITQISNPINSITNLKTATKKDDLSNIYCPKSQCQILIAVPTIIHKNGRLAYRMLTGKFHRKKIKK